MYPGSMGPFIGWAGRKTNDFGDPLDTPKTPKGDAGYVIPPKDTPIECSTCVNFRPPQGCSKVGNEGAIIYPQGCCNYWMAPGMLASTYEDPNPGDLPAPNDD